VEPNTKLSFELTTKTGAVLITNHWTYCEDIERTGDAGEYTKRHYTSWVKFARDNGHGNERPILVTGVALTKQFASMACSDRKSRVGCDFTVGVPAAGSGSLTAWGSWNTQDPLVHTNGGPLIPPAQGNQSLGVTPRLQILPAQGNQDPSLAPGLRIPPDHNQCIFLSYFTMKYWILRARAGPHQLPGGESGNYDTGTVAVEPFRPDDGDSTQDANQNKTNDPLVSPLVHSRAIAHSNSPRMTVMTLRLLQNSYLRSESYSRRYRFQTMATENQSNIFVIALQ
jgi:hypothetical protein